VQLYTAAAAVAAAAPSPRLPGVLPVVMAGAAAAQDGGAYDDHSSARAPSSPGGRSVAASHVSVRSRGSRVGGAADGGGHKPRAPAAHLLCGGGPLHHARQQRKIKDVRGVYGSHVGPFPVY